MMWEGAGRMVRFCCEQCGRKISVQDNHAGKRGKCPECGTVIVIPTKSTVVTFQCQNCERNISIPKTYSGKEAQCPNCKERLVVPATDLDDSSKTPSSPTERKFSTGVLTFLDVPKKYRLKDESASQMSESEKAIGSELELEEEQSGEEEAIGRRKLPWPIDVFFYPVSPSGLISLAIIVSIPILIAVVKTLMGPLGIVIILPGFFLNLAVGLYLCWFITECVRDSAIGGTRAPEIIATSNLGDIWSQGLQIIGCYLILLGPVGFYYVFTGKTDAIFWLLLAYGAFFFPMGLLACIMFDSIRGLNPILLIGSIISTYDQYLGLVLLIVVIVITFSALSKVDANNTEQPQPPNIPTLIVVGIFFALVIYTIFVVAHLIGRFYWRNQEKLNWEV
jgi:DNA-directed RNA polymerase subunit RPC12/RpoP